MKKVAVTRHGKDGGAWIRVEVARRWVLDTLKVELRRHRWMGQRRTTESRTT